MTAFAVSRGVDAKKGSEYSSILSRADFRSRKTLMSEIFFSKSELRYRTVREEGRDVIEFATSDGRLLRSWIEERTDQEDESTQPTARVQLLETKQLTSN